MEPYPPEVEETMRRFYHSLNEKDRRRLAGWEALRFGPGGRGYIACPDFSRSLFHDHYLLRFFAAELETYLLNIENYFTDILHYVLEGREFMQRPFDLHCGDGRSLNRGQQNSSQ